mmetsp:Transcript_138061/g.240108  ORF Transcript_138061/g.240108 Transcript_138061/m.240108 type:complete len:303 (+) Transcript_138061:110-1018(+)
MAEGQQLEPDAAAAEEQDEEAQPPADDGSETSEPAPAWHIEDLGWVHENSDGTICCSARAVMPWAVCLVTCRDKCASELGWQPARVSVLVQTDQDGRTLQSLLRCKWDSDTPDQRQEMGVPLHSMTGLRCLRDRSNSGRAGLEIKFSRARIRLQLFSQLVAENQSLANARFQLLHAFLALSAEEGLRAMAMQRYGMQLRPMPRQIVPLEWPLPGGREVTLAHLASVLRGVNIVGAGEVLLKARFAGQHCPVCLELWEQMPAERRVATLSCGHAFCEDCLAPHAEWQAACPSCRGEFAPIQNS